MPRKARGFATVIRQTGDQLRVRQGDEELAVTMVGFPEGFELREGDWVALTEKPVGPAAEPLVTTLEAEVEPARLRQGGEIEVGGHTLTVPESAKIHGPRSGSEDEPRLYHILCIDRDRDDEPDVVMAARPARST